MDGEELGKKVHEAADFVRGKFTNSSGETGIILGSGLGPFVDKTGILRSVDAHEIPNYPISTVSGHAGKLVLGSVRGINVIIVQGRVHFYEGYEPWQVSFSARLLHVLGVKSLIVTNAAGSSNPEHKPGEFMILKNHLNFQGREPLEEWERAGTNDAQPYDAEYRQLAHEAAAEVGVPVREGVLAANLGPSYETPAEVMFQSNMGADAASMSTYPEVTVANHLGMRVFGMSVLTNYAAGLSVNPLTHSEVTEMADKVAENFSRLLEEIVVKISQMEGRHI